MNKRRDTVVKSITDYKGSLDDAMRHAIKHYSEDLNLLKMIQRIADSSDLMVSLVMGYDFSRERAQMQSGMQDFDREVIAIDFMYEANAKVNPEEAMRKKKKQIMSLANRVADEANHVVSKLKELKNE